MSETASLDAPDLESERKQIQTLLETWQAMQHLGPDEWQPLTEEALARSQRLGDPMLLVRSLIARGQAHVIRLECPQALALASQALALLEGSGQTDVQAGEFQVGELQARDPETRDLEARAHRLIGRVHYDLGDDGQALEAFERALQCAQDQSLALRLRGHIAAISIELGHLPEAITAIEQVLASPECDNRANMHSNLAIAWFRLSHQQQEAGLETQAQTALERAGEHIQRALMLARAESHHDIEAHALVTQADILEHQGDPDQALEVYRQAIRVAQISGFPWVELQALINVGGLEHKRNHHQKAIEVLDQALERAEQLGFKEQASRIHRHLADAHEALDHLREALAHHRQFHDLDAVVKSEAATRRLESLTVRFQVERAQLEAQWHRERAAHLAALNEQLEHQALTDALTGLANRRAFGEHFQRMFAAARKAGSALTVVLVDLDHFKRVNDVFSHTMGDEVLRVFAQVLLEHCRVTDLAARYGGEEFVVLMPGVSGQAAFEACERLRMATEGFAWSQLHPELRVTASFGYCDDLAVTAHTQLLEVADQHLYVAKANGRNRVEPLPLRSEV
jgi:diguanylate cyclase (GGDEF)-like protein